ncbi:cellulose-binding protein [Colletotrichum salicis]|uniref:Cellulose-binding protein n=1 Tax=Colletotrichum salicis TaxID=1209931 RepID=A0A135V248_9PEZI|nr:cellulose-binding protein [Colletotrichum salicis]
MTNNPQNCRAQSGSFDLYHEGHSGLLSINIANQYLQGWLASTKPDIVQFMLGTTDIVASYTKMTGLMRASNPRMKILVCTPATSKTSMRLLTLIYLADDRLIPLSFNGRGIDALNQRIPGWAIEQNSTNSPIIVADCSCSAGFTTSMLRDGVHPNDQGDQVIARQLGPLLIKYVKDLIAERGL